MQVKTLKNGAAGSLATFALVGAAMFGGISAAHASSDDGPSDGSKCAAAAEFQTQIKTVQGEIKDAHRASKAADKALKGNNGDSRAEVNEAVKVLKDAEKALRDSLRGSEGDKDARAAARAEVKVAIADLRNSMKALKASGKQGSDANVARKEVRDAFKLEKKTLQARIAELKDSRSEAQATCDDDSSTPEDPATPAN